MMRRTKIVATVGPATDSPQKIGQLIKAGLDVARLNFSHGDHASHRRCIELLRQKAAELGRTVGILQDLAGPKIRLGDLEQGEMELVTGGQVVLCPSGGCTRGRIPVNYPYLTQDVALEDRILLADGLVELKVLAKDQDSVTCEVLVGGVISSRKGVNLPVSALRIPSFTDKDKADLELGLECGVDFVALSFVRHERDLDEVRERINHLDNPPPLDSQDRKTPGRGAPAPDSGRSGRGDGGPGGFGGGDAFGRGAPDPKAHHPPGPARGQAGDHRHPDAALHDGQPQAHPGRGQ